MNETQHPPADPQGDPAPAGDAGTTGPGPRVTSEQLRDLGRLHRPHDRKVAGVAAGLARHLDIDPLVLRIAFVVLTFFGGAGLVAYAALWALVPQDGATQAPVHLDEKSRGVALVGVGVLATLLVLGDTWNLYWFPWPLALIALAVWFFFFRDRGSDKTAAAPHGSAEPYAAGPTHAPYADPYATGPTHPPYADPYAAATATGPAAGVPYPPRPPLRRPRDPRKRGPRLFWFTCALAALAVGVLGIVDLAGVEVLDSAYPALVLAIVAVMLLVGAFYGRAGGLILLGLVAATVTTGTLAGERYQDDHQVFTPTRAEQVEASYDIGAGELLLDLRQVRDLDELDGRELEISGGVGLLEVVVPEGLDVDVEASIDGPGNIQLFDTVNRGGIDTSATAGTDRGDDQPQIWLDVSLGVGEIIVTTS